MPQMSCSVTVLSARTLGTVPAEVVRRHTASPWTVAFTGFAKVDHLDADVELVVHDL